MPFNVVETVDARGHKELLAVPEPWVQGSSKGRTYLFWPNIRRKERLNELIEDDNSTPTNSWERILCRVKRVGLATITEANKVINDMCLESSTDFSEKLTHEKKKKPQKVKQRVSRPVKNFESMLEPCIVENNEYSYEVTRCVLPENPEKSGENEWLDESEVDESLVAENFKESISNNSFEHQNEPEDQLKSSDLGTHNIDLNERLQRLECAMSTVISKVDVFANETVSSLRNQLANLEKATSIVIAKLDILTDKTVIPVSMRHRKNNNIGFEPIATAQELTNFEMSLSDNSYFNEIATWLENNIYENTPENRMIEIMDLIFTKQFLTECSWTGISKGKEKIPLITYKNVLELFRFHGSTNDVDVTMRMVAVFFMKKLKNATKRAATKGLRKSTQHKF
ncbi:uncharacterized protein LOC125770768 [Anopheles funestus]|uniref:uncharacterized protein LOC125767349 n=1 Tax=Anopheles funestus TaxID=62324 RepID=UPI0020C5F869|nr:uncharacterized protein LOC125767349 [Anopheles funestus]XP_049296694.1 uncharacterized protein LOC125770768 [Anopheles funestus]